MPKPSSITTKERDAIRHLIAKRVVENTHPDCLPDMRFRLSVPTLYGATLEEVIEKLHGWAKAKGGLNDR